MPVVQEEGTERSEKEARSFESLLVLKIAALQRDLNFTWWKTLHGQVDKDSKMKLDY